MRKFILRLVGITLVLFALYNTIGCAAPNVEMVKADRKFHDVIAVPMMERWVPNDTTLSTQEKAAVLSALSNWGFMIRMAEATFAQPE